MPRKTKSVKAAEPQPTLTDQEPQPTLTEEPAATQEKPKSGRTPQGQFAKGNAGGPGNPHARHCARMLEIFRNAISEEHFIRVVLKLLEKAEAGDTSAAKIIVTYVVGKPLPAPHPDSIDRDEWDHFQKDAMNQRELAVVMNSLPTQVGNDVVRVALPIMTDARTRDLAKQLLKGCPGVKRGERTGARDEEKEEVTEPLANGDSSEPDAAPTTLHTPLVTIYDPLANGDSSEPDGAPSAFHTSPATTRDPIPNGKKMYGKKMRKARANRARESSRSSKVAPLANGKLSSSDRASHSTPPSTPAQPSTGHQGAVSKRQKSENPDEPATQHASHATNSPPLPNRKSVRAKKDKNRRKKAVARKLEPLSMSCS